MIEVNELIEVKQLPIIEQQLRGLKVDIEKEVAVATSLVCTEDTVKDIKKTRAELNSKSKELEAKRIEIKNAIMGPYNDFEKIFKECVTTPLLSADKDLKKKIDEIENEVKKQKEDEVKLYYNEYIAAKDIDFLNYEKAGINVTLSSTVKKLKEQVQAFIDRVCDDLALIETQENKAEILVEYKRTLNCSQAITTVVERQKAIEKQRIADDERKAKVEEEKKRRAEVARIASEKEREKIASIPAPVAVETPKETFEPVAEIPYFEPVVHEEIFTLSFKVRGTKLGLKELKDFLERGGYDYE